MSVSRVPRAKIDYDILVVLMKSMEGPYRSNKAVISVLSRTCRHLHKEGVKCLLARGVFVAAPQAASFGRFILADPTSRGPLLHSLEIFIRQASQTTLDLFLTALSHAVYLSRLTLDSLESLPRIAARRLCTAIESLTSVTDFTLVYRGGEVDYRLQRDPTSTREEYFPELLRRLRIPITSVTLQLPPMYDNDACIIYTRARDPIFLLSGLRKRLEQVTLSGNITVGGGKSVYPRVTRLSLPESYEWGLALLQPYIVSFPNVTTVGVLYIMIRREAKDVDVLNMRRSGVLLKEWHNINTRNQIASGTWPGIQSLRATIMDAYVYGISCHIKRVHLLSIGGKHSVELAMLSTILAYTRPTILRLAIKIWYGRDSLPILPPTSSVYECITSLDIRINVIMQRFDIDAYTAYVTDMLHGMRILKSFQLEIRCNNMESRNMERCMSDDLDIIARSDDTFDYCYCDDGPSRKDHGCYLQDIMNRVDLCQLAREFMAAAPALRRVTLMWKRCHELYESTPNHVVGIDLDLLPHSWDRPGNESDMWWELDW